MAWRTGGRQNCQAASANVALARSIVLAPEVLVLDEPLAAVDALLRGELRTQLRSLQRELAMTFVYVTHDRDEAFALSDRVAVMSAGRIVQVGTPRQLYETPATSTVAELMGTANLLDANIGTDGKITIGPLTLLAPTDGSPGPGPCVITIRPQHLSVSRPGGPSEPATMSGRIDRVDYRGATTELVVRLDHGPTVVAPSAGDPGVEWSPGDPVTVTVAEGAVRMLPPT